MKEALDHLLPKSLLEIEEVEEMEPINSISKEAMGDSSSVSEKYVGGSIVSEKATKGDNTVNSISKEPAGNNISGKSTGSSSVSEDDALEKAAGGGNTVNFISKEPTGNSLISEESTGGSSSVSEKIQEVPVSWRRQQEEVIQLALSKRNH